MIRRRAARWLLVSIAAATLFGCEAGSDQSAPPVVSSNEPTVSTPAHGVDTAVVASREVLSVTVAALAVSSTTVGAPPAPAPTVVAPTTSAKAVTPAPVSVTTTEAPAVDASLSANEMQIAPTTTQPPTTTVRTVAPPATVAPVLTPASAAVPLNAAAAADFQSRTNTLRTSLGLGALSRNAQLDAYAAAWARELAVAGKLSHSTSPEAAIANGWNFAGENVGFGSTVTSVQDALVSSAGHYANLAKPSYTAIGVAVAVGPDGRLWLCEVFAG